MNYRQVHLDFHTGEKIPDIGAEFNKEQFQKALIRGHINSITLFSKCHHGWAYHPSKANEMHPNLKFDLLKAQIEAAHEIGVKTPVYISAGFDEKTVYKHPEWMARLYRSTGCEFHEPMYHLLCMNTPYLDYLLEQVKEVCENYDADGIFLDIVAVRTCFCPSCLKSMFERGLDPNSDEDVIALGEEVYKNYYTKVEEVVHKIKPDMPIFHNGGHIRQGRRDLAAANSHLELESLPTGGWGYDHFPLSAAYSQLLGKEMLGMTGKFHKSWGEFGGYKHPNALIYETSLNAAFGAGSSIGDQLDPNGKMDMYTYSLIGAAYEELEKKEPWLNNTDACADVGVFSVEANKNMNNAYQNGPELETSDIGVGRILLEGKYLFQYIDEYTDFNNYKVIVLPDEIAVNDDLKKKLNNFLKNGGKVLATGKSGIDMGKNKFVFDFGCKYVGKNPYMPSYMRRAGEETDFIMYSEGQKVELTTGTELAKSIEAYFNRTRDHFCSHFHTPSSHKYLGSGMTEGKDGIYIAWDIFRDYAENAEIAVRYLVCEALDRLLSDKKTLKTNLKSAGVATLRKNENQYIAHLLYATPIKRGKDIEVIEDIIPIYNIELSVKLDNVEKVYLAPQMQELSYSTENGYCNVTVPEICGHQMVVFD